MSDPTDTPRPAVQWSGVRTTVNGTSFFRSGLFVFLCGQGITAVIGICAFMITLGGMTERFTALSNRVAANEATQKRMDDQGTNFSHYGIASDTLRIQSLEARVLANETAVKKIDVMDEKITRIDETVKEIRDGTRAKSR